ncbi:MAG: hypothetical protein ACO38S_06720, partial [Gemmobacter sp.]
MKARSGATGGHDARGSAGPPRPARRRRLDPEEEALWKAVARSARPLHPSRPEPEALPVTPPVRPAPP